MHKLKTVLHPFEMKTPHPVVQERKTESAKLQIMRKAKSRGTERKRRGVALAEENSAVA